MRYRENRSVFLALRENESARTSREKKTKRWRQNLTYGKKTIFSLSTPWFLFGQNAENVIRRGSKGQARWPGYVKNYFLYMWSLYEIIHHSSLSPYFLYTSTKLGERFFCLRQSIIFTLHARSLWLSFSYSIIAFFFNFFFYFILSINDILVKQSEKGTYKKSPNCNFLNFFLFIYPR